MIIKYTEEAKKIYEKLQQSKIEYARLSKKANEYVEKHKKLVSICNDHRFLFYSEPVEKFRLVKERNSSLLREESNFIRDCLWDIMDILGIELISWAEDALQSNEEVVYCKIDVFKNVDWLHKLNITVYQFVDYTPEGIEFKLIHKPMNVGLYKYIINSMDKPSIPNLRDIMKKTDPNFNFESHEKSTILKLIRDAKKNRLTANSSA